MNILEEAMNSQRNSTGATENSRLLAKMNNPIALSYLTFAARMVIVVMKDC
jgi:hypothetical protein